MPIPLVSDVRAILAALEARRPAVASHCRRVAAYGVRPRDPLRPAGGDGRDDPGRRLLHDIGKLLVPVHILSKPGRLTEQEWQALQSHPEHGFEMAEHLGFAPGSSTSSSTITSGNDAQRLPDGLDGNAIPWTVRIVSVMDAFDALDQPAHLPRGAVGGSRPDAARPRSGRPLLPVGRQRPAVDAPDDARRGGVRRDRLYRPDARPSEAVLLAATTRWVAAGVEAPGHPSAW